MCSRRGGGGNVGTKRSRNISYDFVVTFYNAVPLEVKKGITTKK